MKQSEKLAERECRAVETLLRPTPVISVVNLNGQEVQRISVEPKNITRSADHV